MLAAERRRKEPRQVPRPGQKKKGAGGNPRGKHGGLFAAAMKRAQVRYG